MSALIFRLAKPSEFPFLQEMIVDSFEPITWFKKLDERFGPLNGCDWRARWIDRLERVFATQIVLVGEGGGEIVAVATGTMDRTTRLGFIDLLAVGRKQQGKGYGRDMLRGMLDRFRQAGMQHANLECLTDNEPGNSLYRSEGWEIMASSHRWFISLDHGPR
jgi:ribosomal protein S18 acetylase RimI-like enzyme